MFARPLQSELIGNVVIFFYHFGCFRPMGWYIFGKLRIIKRKVDIIIKNKLLPFLVTSFVNTLAEKSALYLRPCHMKNNKVKYHIFLFILPLIPEVTSIRCLKHTIGQILRPWFEYFMVQRIVLQPFYPGFFLQILRKLCP